MFACLDNQDWTQDIGIDVTWLGGSQNSPYLEISVKNSGEKLIKKKRNLDEIPKFEKTFYQEHTILARNSRNENTPKKQGN